jgi:hypothetical protein
MNIRAGFLEAVYKALEREFQTLENSILKGKIEWFILTIRN